MSVESHLASLEKKHLALESELETVMNRPRPEDNLVVDLKRKKLRLKDRMEAIRHEKIAN